MKYGYAIALSGILLSGCWDQAETLLSATNDCREEMRRGCRECLDRNGEIVVNYDSTKFYTLCMDRHGYSMGLAEGQRCLNSPSTDCYGMGDKVANFWDRYKTRLGESFEHIRSR